MVQKRGGRSVTLTGIVIPVDWNDDHEVTVTALATADEREYRVVGNRKGKEMRTYLQRQVEATGSLDEDASGRPVITIKRYIVK
ncbi:MAG: hypothetical protein AB1558_07890 [Thermodesulfobacteriota bacterium]